MLQGQSKALMLFSTLIVFQLSGPSLLFPTRRACGPCSPSRGGLFCSSISKHSHNSHRVHSLSASLRLLIKCTYANALYTRLRRLPPVHTIVFRATEAAFLVMDVSLHRSNKLRGPTRDKGGRVSAAVKVASASFNPNWQS